MTKSVFTTLLATFTVVASAIAQSNAVSGLFPTGTQIYNDLVYANDSAASHRFDLYLPSHMKAGAPLIVWIHGGAWMMNDKHADMGYMKTTIKAFVDSGYALASINYRLTTEAGFPAQIQDCNQALEFLYQHAGSYHYDPHRIAVIGFSAGGHLASLLALSANNHVKSFFPPGITPHFQLRCLLDFYGPADLVALAAVPDSSIHQDPTPIERLLRANPLDRPDLARLASPATYVDRGDPPTLIVQGEKDGSVPKEQSLLLNGWLELAHVPHQLIILQGAPHFGERFDAPEVRTQVLAFLRAHL